MEIIIVYQSFFCMEFNGLRQYYVYILANKNRTKFMSGVTADLDYFLKELMLDKNHPYLVYVELFDDVFAAVEREIVISAYSHKKKQQLLASFKAEHFPEIY